MDKYNQFPYSYEENGEDGQPQIEVAHDDGGAIGAIFVYNQSVDAMILVDLEAFERRHPYKFMDLQERINDRLPEIAAAKEADRRADEAS